MSRTQLSNLVYHVSLFENLVTLTLLSSGRPSLIAMPCASSGLEFPVNSLILGMTSALYNLISWLFTCTVLCTVARGLEATNKKKKDWSVGVAGVKG